MIVVGAAAAAALAIMLNAPVARAQAGPAGEPAAPEETRFRREGFAIGLGLGPALFIGGGDVGGIGGAVSLRVGTTASSSVLWLLQLDTGSYAVRIVDEANPDSADTSLNVQAALTLGAQVYLREVLWVKAGAGFGSFERHGASGTAAGERRGGVAILGSAGYDLFRRGVFAIDAEAIVTAIVHGGAMTAHGSLGLGATWY